MLLKLTDGELGAPSMADVFLSYNSADRDRVKHLADALQDAGLSVWWDRNIEPGKSFDKSIQQALADALCVVVVWSANSVESNWVLEEADEGLKRNILVPVLIDDCEVPLGFRRVQAAQLIGWPNLSLDPSGVILRVTSLVGERLAPTEFRVEQRLGFARAVDGTRIAYATCGAGPPIVQVIGWGTHLEDGINSPIYDNEGLAFLSSRKHLYITYDGRGCGLSDRETSDFSLDARVCDLACVVDSLALDRFDIIAVSAGGPAAIAYAAAHPKRVRRLVLAGASASAAYGSEEEIETFRRLLDLFEVAWDRPEVTNMFADRILTPGGDDLDIKRFGEMLRRATDGPSVAAFFRESLRIEVRDQATQLRQPTLVIQARDDQIVTMNAGRELAALVPGSEFRLVVGGHLASSASTSSTRKLALQFLEAEE